MEGGVAFGVGDLHIGACLQEFLDDGDLVKAHGHTQGGDTSVVLPVNIRTLRQQLLRSLDVAGLGSVLQGLDLPLHNSTLALGFFEKNTLYTIFVLDALTSA
jgi:hypothetical protein